MQIVESPGSVVVYLGDASDGNVLAAVSGNFGSGVTVHFVASSDGVQSVSPVATATPETPSPVTPQPADAGTLTAAPATDSPRSPASAGTPTSGALCVSGCTSVAILSLAVMTAGVCW